ncbi:MAG: acyltransferase [Blastocatellia bacterium]|nr:acyltransferase [Blastocatellia bacterium]
MKATVAPDVLPVKSNSSPRIPELDGVRGLAILVILLGHHFNAIFYPAPDSPLVYLVIALRYTWSGVDLFFVLSGYLIGGILLDHRQALNYYKVFYVRRIYRIFPLFYLNLFVFFALLAVGVGAISTWLFQNPLPFWSYFTFTQNFASVYYVAYVGAPAAWMGVTWSLAVEEQFYFVMPWVIRKCKERWLPLLLIGAVGVAMVLRFFVYNLFAVGSIANYVMTPTRIDGLMMGVLIAYLLRRPDWRQKLESHRRLLWVVFGFLAAGLAGLNIWRQELATAESIVMTTVGYTWISLFYAMMLLLVLLNPQQRITAFFRTAIMRWLGEISYGFYLLHIPVIGLCYGLVLGINPRIANLKEFSVSLLALAISLALATISWRWLERPLVRRGHSLQYQSANVGENAWNSSGG